MQENATFSEMLFDCEAIKVAPAQSPFLYTSGLIGPYYINTHYLCGGPAKSEEILTKITTLGSNPSKVALDLPKILFDTINSFPVYNKIIKNLTDLAEPIISKNNIKFVTGGQRRDWFFSVPLARSLSLPHLYIFNNLSIYDDEGKIFTNINDGNVLHVADLLSVGSSYLSKWIPALDSVKLKIVAALNCVDRRQGGEQNLIDAGISEVRALCSINNELFTDAHSKRLLTKEQLSQILDFINDPFITMKNFLLSNPDFIEAKLASDDKSKERIKKTIEDDLYKLGDEFIKRYGLISPS